MTNPAVTLGQARLAYRQAAAALIEGGWSDTNEIRPRMDNLHAAFAAMEIIEASANG